MIYKGKEEYNGYWENGRRHGEGVFTYQNGDMYSGWWKFGESSSILKMAICAREFAMPGANSRSKEDATTRVRFEQCHSRIQAVVDGDGRRAPPRLPSARATLDFFWTKMRL